MASPKTFTEVNSVWKGNAEEGVADLPVFRDPRVGVSVSCWKLTEEELECVKQTGQVWLHLYGQQPPVYIGGTYPFHSFEQED